MWENLIFFFISVACPRRDSIRVSYLVVLLLSGEGSLQSRHLYWGAGRGAELKFSCKEFRIYILFPPPPLPPELHSWIWELRQGVPYRLVSPLRYCPFNFSPPLPIGNFHLPGTLDTFWVPVILLLLQWPNRHQLSFSNRLLSLVLVQELSFPVLCTSPVQRAEDLPFFYALSL